jgi:DNA-binding SARP family transcriptional activator
VVLSLTLLGGFEARSDAGPPVTFTRKKSQALLAYLALHLGQPQPRDKLAALLWGEASDQQARHSLRQALTTLRQALAGAPSSCLIEEGDAVTLSATAQVDVTAFEKLAERGTPEALESAIGLYRGDLLAGIGIDEAPFEEWLLTERERLRELAGEALAKLLAHQTQAAMVEPAVQTAMRLLALDPAQEPVHRTLMRLYARDGRRGAALRQYQTCVALLERELGVEPEPETKQLYRELLQTRPRVVRAQIPPERGASDTILVGREAEMAQLRRALDEAWQGRGSVALLQGEAGIGKSRLIEALMATALGRGGHVLLGRAHESEQILPFSPWIHALRAGQVVPDTLGQLDEIWRSELARLFPELRPGDREPMAGEDYVRLFEAMSRVVQFLASGQPLLIVLEDLHWADEMTHRLLVFLSRRLADWPVLAVGTLRVEELAEATLLRRSIAQLGRQSRSLSLSLSPLSETETRTLVGTLTRAGMAQPALDRLAEHVWRTSEGNPFMVVETVRALQGRELAPGEALPTPSGVRDLLAGRLERLSERGRRLAGVAAVIGREFDFAVLQQTADLSPAEAAEGVEELVGRRLLHVIGERLDFSHDRIREVAYEGVLLPHRRLLHAAVARTLETLHAEHPSHNGLALGRHHYASEAWERAWPYLAEAGAGAAARYAHREAVACFEQALSALEHLPRSRDLTEKSIDLRFQLRQSCVPLRDHRRILEHLGEAEAAARSLGDRARLGWSLVYRTHGLFLAGDCPGALAAGSHARVVAGEASDDELQESANFYLAQMHHWLGNYSQATELLHHNVTALENELARRGLPARHIVTSRTFLAWCLAEVGEFEEAITRAEEAIQAAEKQAAAYYLVYAYSGAGLVHLRRGDADRAIVLSERAIELCRGRDFSGLWVIPASVLGPALTLTGRATEAIPLLEEATELAGALAAPVLGFLAEAYLAAGRAEEARASAGRAAALAEQRGERGWRAWALRALGDITAVEAPYRTALTLADECGMRPLAGHCHLGLARLHRLNAHWHEADEQLAKAATTYRELDMRFWLGEAEKVRRLLTTKE